MTHLEVMNRWLSDQYTPEDLEAIAAAYGEDSDPDRPNNLRNGGDS